jgi:redox-sensitive bicupin YhaK (pirin superfamily)
VTTQTSVTQREAVLIEDAARIRMMGIPVLEALPSRTVPYERLDPFILVHESDTDLSRLQGLDTRHPHRGFDNLWYILRGTVSTGHSTGPGGTFERARLAEGSLLFVRTGRGVWHAEGVGREEVADTANAQWRSVLFWVNLARKDKDVEPFAQVVRPEQIQTRPVGNALVRTLIGEGSILRLGTPAIVYDVTFPQGGRAAIPVPSELQGFAYMLDGEAEFGANELPAKPPQLVLLGDGSELTITEATAGTRFLLMAGLPIGEAPLFNGPFVD